MNSEQYNTFRDTIISEKGPSGLLHSKEYKMTDTVSFVNGFRKGAEWVLIRLKSAFFEVVDIPSGQTSTTAPNAAYNDKVREVAEQLASIQLHMPVFIKEKDSPHFNEFMEQTVNNFNPFARAMVAKIANEVRQALYSKGVPNRREYLIERGLIPAKPDTQTDDDAR